MADSVKCFSYMGMNVDFDGVVHTCLSTGLALTSICLTLFAGSLVAP